MHGGMDEATIEDSVKNLTCLFFEQRLQDQ